MISPPYCGAASLAGYFICRCAAERISPFGEIISASQRDTEPAERVSANSPACSASARNAGYNTTSIRAPEWGGRNSGFAIES